MRDASCTSDETTLLTSGVVTGSLQACCLWKQQRALASSPKVATSFLASSSEVVMAALMSLVEVRLSSLKISDIVVVIVLRIEEEEDTTMHLADPEGKMEGGKHV